VLGPIEQHLAASPAISDCVLYCPDNRYLVAVVSPTTRPPDTDAIAEQAARTRATLGHGVQIRKVIVVRDQFSTGNGLLSAQFKPKRKAILAACGPQIYDDDPGDGGLVVIDLEQPGRSDLHELGRLRGGAPGERIRHAPADSAG
jgi:long-chain acyl-CoA synthetase